MFATSTSLGGSAVRSDRAHILLLGHMPVIECGADIYLGPVDGRRLFLATDEELTKFADAIDRGPHVEATT